MVKCWDWQVWVDAGVHQGHDHHQAALHLTCRPLGVKLLCELLELIAVLVAIGPFLRQSPYLPTAVQALLCGTVHGHPKVWPSVSKTMHVLQMLTLVRRTHLRMLMCRVPLAHPCTCEWPIQADKARKGGGGEKIKGPLALVATKHSNRWLDSAEKQESGSPFQHPQKGKPDRPPWPLLPLVLGRPLALALDVAQAQLSVRDWPSRMRARGSCGVRLPLLYPCTLSDPSVSVSVQWCCPTAAALVAPCAAAVYGLWIACGFDRAEWVVSVGPRKGVRHTCQPQMRCQS